MEPKNKPMLSDAQVQEIARHFSILSEPSRLKLLRSLMDESLTVTDLVKVTGMRQGNVSKHLGVLLDAHFVAKEKEGNFARYSIADPKLAALCELMCGRIEDQARARHAALVSNARNDVAS
jgi:DNA-binding transcriptional ArsR family regulator